MNCCSGGNNYLWILIILVILGTCGNVFSSSAFRGCGWPLLAALAYCLCKNGTIKDAKTIVALLDYSRRNPGV